MHARPPLQGHGGSRFPSAHTHSKEERHKGTLENGLVIEHLFFSRNQWNHSQSHMPTGVRAQIPANEGGEEAEHMDEDALAPQQGGRADSVVISCSEYDLLSGAHQRMVSPIPPNLIACSCCPKILVDLNILEHMI
jgi:hypothetical protein